MREERGYLGGGVIGVDRGACGSVGGGLRVLFFFRKAILKILNFGEIGFEILE